MVNLELLKTIAEIPAVSGNEDKLVTFSKEYMEKYADEVSVDDMGNVVGVLKGTDEEAPKLLVQAHMDELGLMVRRIEEDGFLRVERIGGIDMKGLLSREVRIITDSGIVEGVVGVKSHHVMKPEEKYTVPPYEELYVDVGASGAKEARDLGIKVGDMIGYMPNFRVLNDKLVSSKSMDDRAGLFVLFETLARLSKERPKATVYFVASVQEEFSIRGIIPIFHKLKPRLSITLEIALATDTPELKNVAADVRLGKGPAIYRFSFHGRGTLAGNIPHPQLRKYMEKIAIESNIPFQWEVARGAILESAFIQLEHGGIPCIDLGIPCRYVHFPNEVVAIEDLRLTQELLVNFLNSVDRSFKLTRGE